MQELRAEVRAYWESLQPVFDWSPQEKAARSYTFLRRQVLPRRNAVVALEREVSRLNVVNLQREQRRLRERQGALQSFLSKMLVFALTVGILVAVASTFRVFMLETTRRAAAVANPARRGKAAKALTEVVAGTGRRTKIAFAGSSRRGGTDAYGNGHGAIKFRVVSARAYGEIAGTTGGRQTPQCRHDSPCPGFGHGAPAVHVG